MNNNEEIWKDITNWPYHQISNHGNVRVLPGGVAGGKNRIVKELQLRKPTRRSDGYMSIGQGCYTNHLIHHLVLNAFVGLCPLGQQCRHLNGIRSDNRWPENLAWGTPEEDHQDRIKHGTSGKGEHNAMAKLTESDILEIRRSCDDAWELSKRYGVTSRHIRKIREGTTWSHIV